MKAASYCRVTVIISGVGVATVFCYLPLLLLVAYSKCELIFSYIYAKTTKLVLHLSCLVRLY